MNKFDKRFEEALKTLNKEQRQAVETIEGPVMLIAGPGSGKTQVLTLRIAQILRETQANPENILALTYTDSGAVAMRRRLVEFIGPTAYQVNIGTFHSFASRLISLFPHIFGKTEHLRQTNDVDKRLIIDEILKKSIDLKAIRPLKNPSHHTKNVSEAISICKRESVSPDDLERVTREQNPTNKSEKDTHGRLLDFIEVYRRYEAELYKKELYDYEDTILFVANALKSNSEIRAYFQELYQYILVDEYQDTNNSQNSLIESIADFYENPNLFVVGDDKQAIFRFQGASVANMLHFSSKYPQMQLLNLKVNYRSTPNIVNTTNALISNNSSNITKDIEIVSTHQPGSNPVLVECSNELAEYQMVADRILKLNKSGVPLEEIAVLVRRRDQVRVLSRFLRQSDIPVSAKLEDNLFNSQIIRAVLRLLSAIDQPTNTSNLIAALKAILSPKALIELYKYQMSRDKSLLIEYLINHESEELRDAANQIMDLHKASSTLSISELMDKILSETKLLQTHFFTADKLEASSLIRSFYKLLNQYTSGDPKPSLKGFLEYCHVMINYSIGFDNISLLPKGGVNVGTAHGSKGLEFEAVFMVGCSDKYWSIKSRAKTIKIPAEVINMTNWEGSIIEDERRLFYVASTRAKKHLTMSYSLVSDSGNDASPAIFIEELEGVDKESYGADEELLISATRKIIGINKSTDDQSLVAELVRQHIKDAPLSFSSLNTFEKCPQSYLYSRVLNLPQPEVESAVYGNVVHKALELYFSEFKRTKKKPGKEALSKFIEQSVDSIAPESMKSPMLSHAREVLLKYWDAKHEKWQIPVGIEYNFSHNNVHMGDIWITGKIDRIDLIDPKKRTVRIIDYKTKSVSISRNDIIGATKSSDGYMKKQLVFYALLAKHDPLFRYKPEEFVISIIDDTGVFKDEVFVISDEEIEEMERYVEATVKNISQLEVFSHNTKINKQDCRVCNIYDI